MSADPPTDPLARARARRRPLVMGILNVTPDSFSDGGRFLDPSAAVDHAARLAQEGADVVDVGGESTRPGAEPVDIEEELRRVVPVIRSVAADIGVAVSVDTTKAAVAEAALEAGAVMVNDVSGGRFDPSILDVAATAGAHYVAMHMLGEPRTMQDDPRYDDVVDDVARFLATRVRAALEAGVEQAKVWVDPGIGFGKTVEHNLRLLGAIREIGAHCQAAVLVGASRKSFLGKIVGRDVHGRDDATLATSVWAFEQGAAMVRVHDVASTARAVRLLDVLRRATPDGLVDAVGADGAEVAA